jgi:hypothetical protein
MTNDMRGLSNAEIDTVAGGAPFLLLALSACLGMDYVIDKGEGDQPSETEETTTTDDTGDTGYTGNNGK